MDEIDYEYIQQVGKFNLLLCKVFLSLSQKYFTFVKIKIMKYLFKNKFKQFSGWTFYLSIGLGLFLMSTNKMHDLLVVKVFSMFSYTWVGGEKHGLGWQENGLGNELFTILIIVSGIVHTFSKEKIEDELVSKFRMESLTLSLFINYGIVIISTLFVYNMTYMYVLIFNLFSIIFLFNVIFKYRLYKHYTS